MTGTEIGCSAYPLSMAEETITLRAELSGHDSSDFLCLPARQLSGWKGWTYAGAEHVASPSDLVGSPGGLGVLVPRLTVPLRRYLLLREAAGLDWAAGEIVTLAVSMLRAGEELLSFDADVPEAVTAKRGAWWLSAQGRPQFVVDGIDSMCGQQDEFSCVAEVFGDQVRSQTQERAVHHALRSLGQALEEPTQIPRREQELFAFAAPRALQVLPDQFDLESDSRTAQDSPPRRRRDALGRMFISGLTTVARRRNQSVRQRVRQRHKPTHAGNSPRYRRWMLVGGVATVVIVLGMTGIPSGSTDDGGSESVDQGQPESILSEHLDTGDRREEEQVQEQRTIEDREGTEWSALVIDDAEYLLRALVACAAAGGDPSPAPVSAQNCPDVVLPGVLIESENIPRDTRGKLALLDDYGGVVVFRWDPESSSPHAALRASSQILVLARGTEDGWRVRDLASVTDPPAIDE